MVAVSQKIFCSILFYWRNCSVFCRYFHIQLLAEVGKSKTDKWSIKHTLAADLFKRSMWICSRHVFIENSGLLKCFIWSIIWIKSVFFNIKKHVLPFDSWGEGCLSSSAPGGPFFWADITFLGQWVNLKNTYCQDCAIYLGGYSVSKSVYLILCGSRVCYGRQTWRAKSHIITTVIWSSSLLLFCLLQRSPEVQTSNKQPVWHKLPIRFQLLQH